DGIGSLGSLHPFNERRQQIELIERRRAALAVPHAGDEEQTCERLRLLEATGTLCHTLVVADGIEGREPRIAHAVIEELFSAAGGEGAEVGPALRIGELLPGIVDDVRHLTLEVDAERERSAADRSCGRVEKKPRNPGALDRDARVIGVWRIDAPS